MIRYLLLLIVTFMTVSLQLSAQNADDQIDMGSFNEELLISILKSRIDQQRLSKGASITIENEVLKTSAIDQANDNMDDQRIDTRDDIGKRVEKNGGTNNAVALATYATAGRSRDMYTYNKVAGDIIDRFTKSKRNLERLTSTEFLYSGIGVAADPERRRIYVSLVLGGVDALNSGASKELRNSLPLKYSTKKRGLTSGSERSCKSSEKFNHYRELHDGLSIVDNEVYLQFENLKELKRLLRRSKDGISVDFVQREQYSCNSPNIMDNSLPGKGIMTKPIYSDKLMKKNEIEGDRVREYYGPIAKIPKKVLYSLPEGYEMNLIIVQNKSTCKTVKRGYLEHGGQASMTLFDLYPDTTINDVVGNWKINPEGEKLSFIVPFEQGKSTYKAEDIQPILDTLNEPKYQVDEIYIEAYSSLEGTDEINEELQRARAESMVRAIEQIQGTGTDLLKQENIHTSDAWDIFQNQISSDANYAYFVGLDKEKVLEELYTSTEVYDKLESLLEKQRFARVTMEVTYDVSGEFEEPFVLSRLLKSIKKNDGAEALKIQKFALRRVRSGKYSADNLIQMEIPKEEQFASILVNKLYLDTKKNYGGKINPELVEKFKGIVDLAPQNDFASFNYYLTSVKHAKIKNLEHLNDIQGGIQELYSSRIPQKLVDGINLEFQFRTIEYVDSIGSEEYDKITETSMDRIKKIYQIEASSWQNALKLAYIFIEANDIDYALKIMKPFIGDQKINEEFYFTYIAAASEDEENLYSREYKLAMSKAKELNKSRYCDLFGDPYLSFQILDNPLIKEEYCNTCN